MFFFSSSCEIQKITPHFKIWDNDIYNLYFFGARYQKVLAALIDIYDRSFTIRYVASERKT